jgi:hypothetical protein
MDDELAQSVVKVCPNLTEFGCWHCEWLTDATLAVVAQHCPQLREVTLCCCCCCCAPLTVCGK